MNRAPNGRRGPGFPALTATQKIAVRLTHFLNSDLSCGQLGIAYGVSRQAIFEIIKKGNVSAAQGNWPDIIQGQVARWTETARHLYVYERTTADQREWPQALAAAYIEHQRAIGHLNAKLAS